MIARWRCPIDELACHCIDTDARVRRLGIDGLPHTIRRLRARWAQKRCESREFKAWLQITANPLW